MPLDLATDCWFLTGPTASGKSAVGVELAERIGAEIVSLDSMALYRGMDIGTAKPTAEERRRVPHHLIDVLEPHEEFSLAQYVDGRRALRGGNRRPRPAGAVRRRHAAVSEGTAAGNLPGTAGRLGTAAATGRRGPAAWRRVAAPATGRGRSGGGRPPAPERHAAADPRDGGLREDRPADQRTCSGSSTWAGRRPSAACSCSTGPRPSFTPGSTRRVEEMFAAGLVDEVRRLCSPGPLSPWERARVRDVDAREIGDSPSCLSSPHPLPLSGHRAKVDRERGDILARPLSKTARQAVGYREVIEHLEGRRDLAETIALVQRHTRQLAKRQCTWFRSLSECRFVPVSEPFDAGEIAHQITLLSQRP